MRTDILAALGRLSDAQLVDGLKDLAGAERDVTAQLVAHLAEMDTRDVHLREGYGSLFVYCRDVLGLAEHEAYNRIEVARAARRFPVILEMLAAGSVNLTTVRLLAPHLTPANHEDVLQAAHGQRRAQVEEMVARLSPRPDVRPFLRRLPAPTTRPGPLPAPAGAAPTERPAWPLRPATHVVATEPLAPDRYRLQFTIGVTTLEKLRLARDMLRHAVPTGDHAEILDRALAALLADLARKKFAATETPRPSPGAVSRSRHIPAEVKRAVWLRDLGRCAFRGTEGRRCAERAFVEFHHLVPYAAGGEATVDNVELRCRAHNAYEARAYFGARSGTSGQGLEPRKGDARMNSSP